MRPGPKGPWLRKRWVFVALTGLLAVAVVVPLATGGGIAGVLLHLVVFAATAFLLVLLWAVARYWPRGRMRLLNGARLLVMVLLLGVAACLYVGGTRTVARYMGARGDLPGDRFVAVIVCDGASLVQARALWEMGLPSAAHYDEAVSRTFPTISRYFIRDGAFTAAGMSIWPSSSVPAHISIMTGAYPRRSGVLGQRQFDVHKKLHTSYIGLGISALSRMLSRDCKTLCEYFPGVRSLVVEQVANRGCSLYVPTPPHDEQVIRRAVQVLEVSDFLGRFSERCEIPRIVVMTLPDIDHQTHNIPLDDARARAIYLKQDEHLARIIDLYKRKGIYDRTLFVLCSDHGMDAVNNHVTIDNLMHDLRFEVYQSLKWVLVPQWGCFEANFWVGRKSLFDSRYNGVSLWGGNSDAAVYIRGQRKDAAGKVMEESWSLRPTDEDLKHYTVGGTVVNVIGRLLEYSPGIGLILTNPEHGTFSVYSRLGEGRISEGERDGVIEFRYVVVSGRDPLGYADNPGIRPHIQRGDWLTDQEWAELTYLEHYPDALRRISCSFENPNSAHLNIVAADGWDFAPYYVSKHVLCGSHGGLNEHASLVPIMFHGPGVRKGELAYARTVDIVPTILEYLGVEGAPVDGRALPIFEDPRKNREVTTRPENTFESARFGDMGYVYALEHIYASYDRRLARRSKATGQREVLVESVRMGLPALQEQANMTLELIGLQAGKLIFRTVYMGQKRAGATVAYDLAAGRFE